MGKTNLFQRIGRRWWIAIAAFTGTAALAGGVLLLRDVVENRFALPPTSPRVLLVDRPAWMSDALAEQIINTARPVGVHSVFDTQLLKSTAIALSKSPWIKEVRQVRRAYVHWPGDTLEVDCVYRIPTALVKWQDSYWLVDGDGYKLPAEYSPRQAQRAVYNPTGPLTLRIIQGVRIDPPRGNRIWHSDDLAAGLELARLLAGKSFADELPVIDVTNYNGRRDQRAAQIVLVTRYGTQVRWGRPPSAKDYFVEVPTAQKLQSLADIYQQMHRIDAGQSWIDVRWDQVRFPTPQPASAREPANDDIAVKADAN